MKIVIDFKDVGKKLTMGAIGVMGKCLLIFILLMVSLSLLRNIMYWGVDNSDASSWQRSGLRIYTDHLTRVQYVSDGNSLTVRIHADGSPVLFQESEEQQ